MKFGIKTDEISSINIVMGGRLRDRRSIEFAIAVGEGKPSIRKLALLWRAILIDHPFDDGNKRTVELITRRYARVKGHKVNTERLVKEILDISKNNITNLDKIERRIRYATTGN